MTFRTDGFITLPEFMGPHGIAFLRGLIDQCRASAIVHRRDALPAFNPLTPEGSGSERRSKVMIRGNVLIDAWPEIAALYEKVARQAACVLGQELEPPPADVWASCLNANLYETPGDQQGWHVDTNPIAALLFLTDSGESPLTIGRIENDGVVETGRAYAEAGTLVLLDGSRPHRVPEIVDGKRINISMNLYPPGAYARPAQTDGLLYA